MSIHKKILIGYVCINLVLISLGFLNIHEPNYATATDQDLIAHGVSRAYFPLLSLGLTGYFLVFGYLIYGAIKAVALIYRKIK